MKYIHHFHLTFDTLLRRDITPAFVQIAGEALDDIIMDYLGQPAAGSDGAPQQRASILGQLQSTVQSLQRFAKQLSQ